MAIDTNSDVRSLREETDGISSAADALVAITDQLLTDTKLQLRSLDNAKGSANETAAGTHALETAAANMKALSEGLERIVGRYRT